MLSFSHEAPAFLAASRNSHTDADLVSIGQLRGVCFLNSTRDLATERECKVIKEIVNINGKT